MKKTDFIMTQGQVAQALNYTLQNVGGMLNPQPDSIFLFCESAYIIPCFILKKNYQEQFIFYISLGIREKNTQNICVCEVLCVPTESVS